MKLSGSCIAGVAQVKDLDALYRILAAAAQQSEATHAEAMLRGAINAHFTASDSCSAAPVDEFAGIIVLLFCTSPAHPT